MFSPSRSPPPPPRARCLRPKLLGVTRTPGLFYNGCFMTPAGVPADLNAFDKSLREMLMHK